MGALESISSVPPYVGAEVTSAQADVRLCVGFARPVWTQGIVRRGYVTVHGAYTAARLPRHIHTGPARRADRQAAGARPASRPEKRFYVCRTLQGNVAKEALASHFCGARLLYLSTFCARRELYCSVGCGRRPPLCQLFRK